MASLKSAGQIVLMFLQIDPPALEKREMYIALLIYRLIESRQSFVKPVQPEAGVTLQEQKAGIEFRA